MRFGEKIQRRIWNRSIQICNICLRTSGEIGGPVSLPCFPIWATSVTAYLFRLHRANVAGDWRKDNFPDSQRTSLAIMITNLENRSNGDFSSFLLLVSSFDHLSDSFLPRHVEGFEPSARDYCNGVLCNRCTRPVRRFCTISQATLLNGPSSLLFAAITFALAYLYNCLYSVTYLHSLYTFNRAWLLYVSIYLANVQGEVWPGMPLCE